MTQEDAEDMQTKAGLSSLLMWSARIFSVLPTGGHNLKLWSKIGLVSGLAVIYCGCVLTKNKQTNTSD